MEPAGFLSRRILLFNEKLGIQKMHQKDEIPEVQIVVILIHQVIMAVISFSNRIFTFAVLKFIKTFNICVCVYL